MIAPRILPLHFSSPLEDETMHVLHKALRGMGLSAQAFPCDIGISQAEWSASLAGCGSHATLTRIAKELQLHGRALIHLPQYSPTLPELQEVSRFDLPFDSDRVNAWMICHEETCLVFDAGFRSEDCLHLLGMISPKKVDLFVTHQHRDHIGGLSALQPRLKKHWQLSHGEKVNIGTLSITAIDLSGHALPSLGYLIHGLIRPVCVVGDSLFAGSIGGCANPSSYQLALQMLWKHVMSLSPETILLPGHGPATTVEQERINNPFLATL